MENFLVIFKYTQYNLFTVKMESLTSFSFITTILENVIFTLFNTNNHFRFKQIIYHVGS